MPQLAGLSRLTRIGYCEGDTRPAIPVRVHSPSPQLRTADDDHPHALDIGEVLAVEGQQSAIMLDGLGREPEVVDVDGGGAAAFRMRAARRRHQSDPLAPGWTMLDSPQEV